MRVACICIVLLLAVEVNLLDDEPSHQRRDPIQRRGRDELLRHLTLHSRPVS